MKSIGVHDLSTWTPELTELIDEIIRENDFSGDDFDINRMNLKTNQHETLEDYLKNECQIQYWHTSRLTDGECDFIYKEGLSPLSESLIDYKISVLRTELEASIPRSTLSQVINKFRLIARESSRSNYISARDSYDQISSPMNKQTLKYWGGEAMLCAFEELALSANYLIIGKPYLIKICIPYLNLAESVSTRSIPKSLIVARGGKPEYSSVTVNVKIQPKNLSIVNFEL